MSATIRVCFPLLKRKDGKVRKQQKPVRVSLNGSSVIIARGIAVEVPYWVKEICDPCHYRGVIPRRGQPSLRDKLECFVSERKSEIKEDKDEA